MYDRKPVINCTSKINGKGCCIEEDKSNTAIELQMLNDCLGSNLGDCDEDKPIDGISLQRKVYVKNSIEFFFSSAVKMIGAVNIPYFMESGIIGIGNCYNDSIKRPDPISYPISIPSDLINPYKVHLYSKWSW